VEKGEIVAIVGASGAGKSTLLHILGALDRPTSGEVVLDGDAISRLSDRDLAERRGRRVGFVFQFHHLLPEFSALENVMLPKMVTGTPKREAERAAGAVLEEVGLGDRLHHRPGELSGGEQQRVAVARALANEPAVVLADEPSGNLDRENGRKLQDLLWSLREARRQTFVVATHDASIAARADRVFELADGVLTSVARESIGEGPAHGRS
jgi:lipoprotein-releasing system ATP-binding protein